ncbi:type VI secretion system baseplate subunit TssK [Saccharicrinis aurantiacus]|uniref:type VI secretion system baseplate subunit TssK n=1 Tax=Saccharicrinis aurantiacus TaxID=1849719 RepID=UPI00094FED5E|nr:type VI secretion system baseplate subunit TssK [Saccharicrinis aurantiacus]
MIRAPKKQLVNWQESMNVSAEHFIQSENFFIDTSRDYASLRLTNSNYGLLPTVGDKDNANGIRISEHVTGHIEIKLLHCNAITSSGIRVNFNPDDESYLIKDYSPDSQSLSARHRETKQWDIILIVNPFDRCPSGDLDVEETPPRHPNAGAKYDLQVMPSGELNTSEFGSHHLTIGRIRKSSDRYEVDGNYIPPCTSMASHPDLMEYYNHLGQKLSSIEKSSKTIISKVINRQSQTELAENIRAVCEDLLRYISVIYFEFRNKGRYLPPIDIIQYFSTLAHVTYGSLSFIQNKEKEELLKYFYEWSDITPGSFEETLANTLEILYEHDKIRSTMFQIDSFMTILSDLLVKLSQLDHIGQHKENIIVSESISQSDSTQKSKWSILD